MLPGNVVSHRAQGQLFPTACSPPPQHTHPNSPQEGEKKAFLKNSKLLKEPSTRLSGWEISGKSLLYFVLTGSETSGDLVVPCTDFCRLIINKPWQRGVCEVTGEFPLSGAWLGIASMIYVSHLCI